jgi:N-acyl-D-aspartate/D-glutamate deacylase
MDLVLRGGKVVDGTGAPARTADIAIEGDRIVVVDEMSVGELSQAKAIVDVDGLVVAPGFVDIHTHYDAQVTWDPDLTPSSWHGVTSVVMGNCGFGIAPTRPDDRGVIARTLENVEGMSVEALTAGIDWDFETFPQYLDALDRKPKRLNVGALLGHTPLRLYVMGDDATERAATDDEVARMKALVAEGIAAGAVGFATSKSPTHSGDAGKPVPSRLAEISEITELASAMGDAGKGIFQATIGPGFYIKELAELSETIGRPATWTALLTMKEAPGRAVEQLEKQASLGGEVWPQVACRELVMQVTLEDPFPFGLVPGFDAVLAVPRERRADVYADPSWRDRVRPEFARVWGHAMSKTTVQETNRHAELRNGPSIAEIASARGQDPFDTMIELSLDEDLATRFRFVLVNDGEDEIGTLLNDLRGVLGLSDAGAHASQLCDACFSTHLLGYWTREKGVLTLEQAVHRLSGHAAQVFRLEGRGLLSPGAFADICVFDPDTVGVTELERVFDLPGGADRLVAHSTGIEHVWCNGVQTRADGKNVDNAYPGVVLREIGS